MSPRGMKPLGDSGAGAGGSGALGEQMTTSLELAPRQRHVVKWDPEPVFTHKECERVRAFALRTIVEGEFRHEHGGGKGRTARYRCVSHVNCQR